MPLLRNYLIMPVIVVLGLIGLMYFMNGPIAEIRKSSVIEPGSTPAEFVSIREPEDGVTTRTSSTTFQRIVDLSPVDVFVLPEGFEIEKIAEGLTYPTSLTWDDEGNLYVAEAGGGLNPEQLTDSRILRIDDSTAVEVVNLTDKGVFASVVGLAWYDGAFYITHRDPEDLTGAVSRVTLEGEVTTILSGLIDSQAEHQINDIQVGPDSNMYVAVGSAGNAGVVDMSIGPWVAASPDVRPIPCEDIVLLGKNFKTPDFRTASVEDTVMTGAFVPFGVETSVGETIEGSPKCGGSILRFDPANAEASIGMYAWGFRNVIGMAWDPQTGAMYAAENGYDIRGSRPVNDSYDASLKIEEGKWYGVPDFSAARRPLIDGAFNAPDSLQAPIFIEGILQGKELGFLIDHAASGLTLPDSSVVLGLHDINASPSMMDVAPASWNEYASHVFVAEWGDLAPATNPLRGMTPTGSRVVSIDPETGVVEPFVWNEQPGPASEQNALGEGLERPFDVAFGPDDALYIVDYGIVRIDTTLGPPPYDYVEGTGAIWKVQRAEGTAIEPIDTELPRENALAQNYPNPFNPTTTIRFQVSDANRVSIRVYDNLGREVITLINQALQPGTYEVNWSGRDMNGKPVSSGVYIYSLISGSYSTSKQMTLLK